MTVGDGDGGNDVDGVNSNTGDDNDDVSSGSSTNIGDGGS